jgi:site-specific DNA-methyltransferase (adenine-specific)
MNWKIYNEDAVAWAKNYTGEPFHALLTDAPYHLTSIVKRFGKKGSAPAQFGKDGVFSRASKGFMGTQWDGGDLAFRPETWEAFGKVLHPGAFGMAFSASRNWHRMAVAIEDAGFVLHPTIFLWAYGSGFPKATRVKGHEEFDGHRYGLQALKPAVEPIIVFQKPYEGKPVENIVRTGAGALNIDGGRIPTNGENVIINRFGDGMKPFGNGAGHEYETESTQQGRWPANFILTTNSAERLDAQSGITKSTMRINDHDEYHGGVHEGYKRKNKSSFTHKIEGQIRTYDGEGGASRFFYQVAAQLDESDPVYYCAKTSVKERNAGLEEKNIHPTLKPIDLCRYLATLLLPPVEYSPRRVFVPFSGSGSEMIGCGLAGWEEVVGVEFDTENGYVDIAKKRLEHWLK